MGNNTGIVKFSVYICEDFSALLGSTIELQATAFTVYVPTPAPIHPVATTSLLAI